MEGAVKPALSPCQLLFAAQTSSASMLAATPPESGSLASDVDQPLPLFTFTRAALATLAERLLSNLTPAEAAHKKVGDAPPPAETAAVTRVAVSCDALLGTFIWRGADDVAVQLEDGRVVAPVEFERLAGRGSCRNYRKSLYTKDERGRNVPLGTWLKKQNPEAAQPEPLAASIRMIARTAAPLLAQAEAQAQEAPEDPPSVLALPDGASLPLRVPVCCGGTRGLFLVLELLVQLVPAEQQGEGGPSAQLIAAQPTVSPSEFERLGGRDSSRNWRRSLHVQFANGRAIPLGAWMAQRLHGTAVKLGLLGGGGDDEGEGGKVPSAHKAAAGSDLVPSLEVLAGRLCAALSAVAGFNALPTAARQGPQGGAAAAKKRRAGAAAAHEKAAAAPLPAPPPASLPPILSSAAIAARPPTQPRSARAVPAAAAAPAPTPLPLPPPPAVTVTRKRQARPNPSAAAAAAAAAGSVPAADAPRGLLGFCCDVWLAHASCWAPARLVAVDPHSGDYTARYDADGDLEALRLPDRTVRLRYASQDAAAAAAAADVPHRPPPDACADAALLAAAEGLRDAADALRHVVVAGTPFCAGAVQALCDRAACATSPAELLLLLRALCALAVSQGALPAGFTHALTGWSEQAAREDAAALAPLTGALRAALEALPRTPAHRPRMMRLGGVAGGSMAPTSFFAGAAHAALRAAARPMDAQECALAALAMGALPPALRGAAGAGIAAALAADAQRSRGAVQILQPHVAGAPLYVLAKHQL